MLQIECGGCGDIHLCGLYAQNIQQHAHMLVDPSIHRNVPKVILQSASDGYLFNHVFVFIYTIFYYIEMNCCAKLLARTDDTIPGSLKMQKNVEYIPMHCTSKVV